MKTKSNKPEVAAKHEQHVHDHRGPPASHAPQHKPGHVPPKSAEPPRSGQ